MPMGRSRLGGLFVGAGMRGEVPRYEPIRYQGYAQDGQPIDRTVEAGYARVVQHECDHLLAVLGLPDAHA